MSVWPLPRISFRELSSIEEKRPVALLTTNDAWALLNSQLTLPIMIQAEPSRYDRTLFDYLADHLPNQVQAVYVVGQGPVVQAGKIIAARNNKPLIIVPTAIDSEWMFTSNAWVDETVDDVTRRISEDTGPASEVIIDWGLIQSAPEHVRGAGIVDVLSIVTGLLDWRYAAQKGKNPPEQRFSTWAAGVTAGLAKQALSSAAAIGQGSTDALLTMLDMMMVSVQVCNQLGHTRPRAGGEHMLAQILAPRVRPDLLHAEITAPLLILASALHGQDPAPLRDALQAAGVRLDQLVNTDVQLVLEDLPALLEGYGYSILNDITPGAENLQAALETAGLAVDGETWKTPEPAESAPAEDVPAETATTVDVVNEEAASSNG
jgi:glycerol-1-phosphate dehydrogenase [NAD(P)+]